MDRRWWNGFIISDDSVASPSDHFKALIFASRKSSNWNVTFCSSSHCKNHLLLWRSTWCANRKLLFSGQDCFLVHLTETMPPVFYQAWFMWHCRESPNTIYQQHLVPDFWECACKINTLVDLHTGRIMFVYNHLCASEQCSKENASVAKSNVFSLVFREVLSLFSI